MGEYFKSCDSEGGEDLYGTHCEGIENFSFFGGSCISDSAALCACSYNGLTKV